MAEKDVLDSLSKYEDAFDVSAFFQQYCCYTEGTSRAKRVQHTLRCYHDAFQSLPSSSNLKVMDYGSGPVMLPTISAATKASEIVLSDYLEKNRKALQQWLDGDSAALDWSPYFRFVVRDLEGKGEQEVVERQELVRKLVKAVVHCDITQDPPIERGYDQLYDVVISSFVLESTARNLDEYASNTSTLGKLVKPGGLILIYGVENKLGYYESGDRKLPNITATAEFTVQALKDAGFCNLSLDTFLPSDDPHRIYRFIKGTRNS